MKASKNLCFKTKSGHTISVFGGDNGNYMAISVDDKTIALSEEECDLLIDCLTEIEDEKFPYEEEEEEDLNFGKDKGEEKVDNEDEEEKEKVVEVMKALEPLLYMVFKGAGCSGKIELNYKKE